MTLSQTTTNRNPFIFIHRRCIPRGFTLPIALCFVLKLIFLSVPILTELTWALLRKKINSELLFPV